MENEGKIKRVLSSEKLSLLLSVYVELDENGIIVNILDRPIMECRDVCNIINRENFDELIQIREQCY